MVIESLINPIDDPTALKPQPFKWLSISCFAIGFFVLACTPNVEVSEKLRSQSQSLDCPHGQTGELQWNTFMGTNGTHYGNTVKATSQGVYACGMSNTTWGAPVRPFGTGNWEAFIARLNPSTGAFVWNTFLGQTSAASDHCQGIDIDSTGTVYVVGQSNQTWGTPLNAFNLGFDTFVARLDPNGNLQWHTFWGGTGDDKTNDVVHFGARLAVIGTSDRNWGSPIRAFGGGGSDALVMMLDTSGSLLWNTFLGSTGDDVGNAIAVANDGSIYCVGYSLRTWGNPLRPFSGTNVSDGFVAKLDPNGNLLWHTFLGSTSADESRDVAIDSAEDVWVVGFSDGTWLSPIRAHTGDSDGFVAKLSSNGAVLWNTFLGGTGTDITDNVTALSDGAYTSGWSRLAWGTPWRAFQGGLSDAFVARLDTAGNLLTNGFLGSDGGTDPFDDDYGNSISSTGDGRIYVVGDSDAPWGIPTNTFTAGTHPAYIAAFLDIPGCDGGVDGGVDGGADAGLDAGVDGGNDAGPNQNLPTLNYRVSCGCSSETGATPLLLALFAVMLLLSRRLNSVFRPLEQPRDVRAVRKKHQ